MRKKIILIGGGGHCKSVIDVIERTGNYDIFGIIDKKDKVGENVLGYDIIGTDNELEKYIKNGNYSFHISIGFIKDSSIRINMFEYLKLHGCNLPIIISPSAYVSRHSKISEGTIIMHNVIINACSLIGSNCIINNKALIEHDVVIGDHCHISTASVVNGGVKIGKSTFYGSAAVSKEYSIIPDNSFIKANSIYKNT
ncbi:MAG: acetyltransferase [Bacteroidetes bacterium GWE2_29_8]|nr:MAG: acetyltransferase [Bacteroidetes bacterium GWE2_29_8]OFY20039.1 MAG: acetyltransferase [Bacteroidetes bacterium GWF2_29_10]